MPEFKLSEVQKAWLQALESDEPKVKQSYGEVGSNVHRFPCLNPLSFRYTKIQEAWLQALESDEMQDKQGFSRLINYEGKMCCLGLYCSLQPDVVRDGITFKSKSGLLLDVISDPELQDRLGLYGVNGDFRKPYSFDDMSYYSLTGLNDSQKFTFKQIAAIIRQNPTNVFRS